jgi:hypothetical protein
MYRCTGNNFDVSSVNKTQHTVKLQMTQMTLYDECSTTTKDTTDIEVQLLVCVMLTAQLTVPHNYTYKISTNTFKL